ncbi:cytochrome P450 71D10-like [Durio zibethinus]|uniref:Cytochrome P450 71D10-like n=1 Tax=Durio zibethinus TaxID=66656 RepID=A0A6P5WPF0_DURZI|nr:cytochrome P450 71D10-like [Durio zibethinus]
MELEFPPFSFLLTTLLFSFMIARIVKALKAKKPSPKLPGPWKLPLVGNIHQLSGSLPHCTLRDLALKHGPLMHLQLGAVSTVVISSPEFAEEAMRKNDLAFASRPYQLAPGIISYDCTNIIFSPYGSYWRQLRKICVSELLSAQRVKSFKRVRDEMASNLIKTISSSQISSPINLSHKIFSLTYGITATVAFGTKCKEQERFISIITEVNKLATGLTLADLYPSIKALQMISGIRPKLEKLHREADRILENVIAEHKERRTKENGRGGDEKDIVDMLLDLQEHGNLDYPLSSNNIKSVILDIFAAGSETSSTIVEWSMSELLKNPRLMEKAKAEVRQVSNDKGYVDEEVFHELKFLKSVIKETLRRHNPVPLIPRECRENCKLGGYEIPVKTKVLINSWAITRDPRYWNEPEIFNTGRFLNSSLDYKGTDFQYIPFGAGRRICPGISFALANIELQLAQFLYHFDWMLPNGMKYEDLDMTDAPGLTIRRKHDLFAIPIPYHHSPLE